MTCSQWPAAREGAGVRCTVHCELHTLQLGPTCYKGADDSRQQNGCVMLQLHVAGRGPGPEVGVAHKVHQGQQAGLGGGQQCHEQRQHQEGEQDERLGRGQACMPGGGMATVSASCTPPSVQSPAGCILPKEGRWCSMAQALGEGEELLRVSQCKHNCGRHQCMHACMHAARTGS